MSHPKDKHEQEQHHCNCYDPEHHFPGAVLLTDDPASVERLAAALDAIADRGNDLPNSVRLARAIIERLREGS